MGPKELQIVEAMDWVPCGILTAAISSTWVLAYYEIDSIRCLPFSVSTDDFAGPLELQTNLALKGIIGINAMSEIAATVDKEADAKHFKVSDLALKGSSQTIDACDLKTEHL